MDKGRFKMERDDAGGAKPQRLAMTLPSAHAPGQKHSLEATISLD